jgi:hypothetical protein
MSLQDMVPWSIIFGEINKKHAEELRDVVAIIIVDYINDRLKDGWGTGDKILTRGVKWCIEKSMITEHAINTARKFIEKNYYLNTYNKHLIPKVEYYFAYLQTHVNI